MGLFRYFGENYLNLVNIRNAPLAREYVYNDLLSNQKRHVANTLPTILEQVGLLSVKKARVVLAISDSGMRAELEPILSVDYRVEAVADGGAAPAALQRERTDLVLINASPNEISALKKEPAMVDVLLIAISTEVSDEIGAINAGADDFVCWTGDVEHLKAILSARINARKWHRGGQGIETILDGMNDGFIAMDRNWRITFVNRSFMKMVSRLYSSAEELIGQDLWKSFPNTEKLETGRRYRRAMAAQQPDLFEYFYEPLQVWLEIRVQPSPDWLGIHVRDITERRQAEQALRTSEERYRSLFDSIDEGFCVVDMVFDEAGHPVDYIFLEANPAFEIQTGIYQPVGRRMKEIVPEHERHWFEIYGRVAKSGEPLRFVNEAKKLDHRWYDVYAFRLGGDESRKVAILFTDITESKLSAVHLEKRNELLALLSQAAHDLLAATDGRAMVQGLFDLVSRRLGLDVFFNFMVDEASGGLRLDVAGGVDEETKGRFAQLDFGQAVCGTVAQDRRRIVVREVQQCAYDKADGVKAMGVRAYACHPLFVGEQLIGTLSFGSRTRDVFEDDELEFMQTIASYVAMAKERLRIETERTKALQREREASQAKDRFLAVLSHELRTPLTPVLMLAAAREADPTLSPDLARDIAMIRRNVELETKLIDDLLDVSRIATGKLALRPEAVELNGAIRHVCKICEPQIREKRIHLHCDLDESSGQVQADPARLQQVLWNLLKNAVKFTPEGGDVYVSSRRLTSGVWQVLVRDTGIGIAEDALEHIFDAFEQGGEGITRQFGGMGLGLAISKALVELHQGRITATSGGSGFGSTFAVEWPPAVGGVTKASTMETPSEPTVSSKTRLLIVEDHADTARTLALLLKHHGYEVSTASNGASALELLSSESFDLVVSDLGLPDISGFELGQRVRELYPALKCIAMSGYGMEEDMRKSRESGFCEHLVKPVEVARLHQVIQSVIGH